AVSGPGPTVGEPTLRRPQYGDGCPYVRRRVVAGAVAAHLSEPLTSPHHHLAPRPDRAFTLPAQRRSRSCRHGGPDVVDWVVAPTFRLKDIAGPVEHLPSGPDGLVMD